MLLLPLVLAPLVVLAQVPLPAAPALPPPLGSVGTVVTLPYGSFRGASKSGYNSFLGIPFARKFPVPYQLVQADDVSTARSSQ